MGKKDIFYYATVQGVPCYYRQETEEIIPRNKLCELLINVQDWFWDRFGAPEQFTIVIHKKIITRQEIEEKWQDQNI